ncbi:MAG: sulfatase-like hydrolase/transferase [Bdellovibrionota bacterium]
MSLRLPFAARLSVVAAYLLAGLEWVFQITKSSFLGWNPLLRNVQVAVNTAFGLAVFLLLLHLLVWTAVRIAPCRSTMERLPLPSLIPASVLVALTLLLVDNFTYTIFGRGIVHAHGLSRIAYCAGALMFMTVLVRRISAKEAEAPAGAPRGLLCVLALSALVMLATVSFNAHEEPDIVINQEPSSRPNIILFASDGVDADAMSLYGAERPTTPVLESLRSQALVALQAAPNSQMTTSSTTSMLTGINPVTTHVFYPPQLYVGRYGRYSFPATLRRWGYSTFQRSVDYYGESSMLNMRGAFDWINGRRIPDSTFDRLPALIRTSLEWEYLFALEITRRITDRVLHLTGLRDMVDVYGAVAAETGGVKRNDLDEEHLNEALRFIESADRPFFMHLHLMDTHCCSYPEDQRHFFTPGDNGAAKERDLYDSQIFRSDQFFGRVVELLRKRALLDNTILVYSSDHGVHWDAEKRVPLVFLFPHGKHAGVIPQSTQLLDVVPTLLDYLGIAAPAALEGSSILRPSVVPQLRPLYRVTKLATDRVGPEGLFGLVQGAPNWGLRTLGMTLCERRYTLELQSGRMTQTDVPDHQSPCRGRLPTQQQARRMMVEYLSARGYQVGGALSGAKRTVATKILH